MFSKDSLKLKIQTAVTVALIASGIIPAVQAEVTDASVNNPSDTTITNGSTKYAVDLDSGGPYTVINAGTILTTAAFLDGDVSAIQIDDVAVTTLTNDGTMSAVDSGSIYNFGMHGINMNGNGANASIGTLTNSGTISGTLSNSSQGYGIRANADSSTASITTLTNAEGGTISGTAGTTDGYGIYLDGYNADASITITTLTNAEGGTISGTTSYSRGYGIYLEAGYLGSSDASITITTLTNSGTISGTAGTTDGYGIYMYGYNADVSITTLTNSGIISGTASSSNDGHGIYINPDGHSVVTINTLTNTGTISGDTHDIKSQPSTVNIVNLNNSQGKDGDDVLTYNGKLPTNYNVIVNSTSDYGQVSFSSSGSGTTNFGVSSSSTLSGSTTYASVISGLATGYIGVTRSGTVGGYGWSLVLQTGQTDIWDLVITSSRTGYSSRITINSLSKIAAILEAINTAGSNSALTSALDGLSDASLNIALSQIEGVTIKSVNGQSFKKHSSFKRAVSSALSGPSVNSLTKNNYASLSLNDLSLQSDQGGYQVHSFNDFDFKSMANIFKNKDLFSLKSKGSTFFIRTFADQSNQDVVDGNAGYEASTAGFLVGNQNNLSDEIQQGWALGLSTSDTDFDNNFGNSDSKTLHAMIYQNQQYDNFNLGLNIGTYVTKADMDRKVTEGVSQTLKSKTYDYGFDITADIKQSYQLENNFTFTPSFSTNISYILQDDVDESGGDLALSVNNDNLLIVKPEIGFALDKNFKNTETVSQNFGFSVYGSYEDKLEGTTSKAKIKDTGSNFDIVDDNTDDTFITAGLGFTSKDKEKNQEYNLGIYHTQNDDNDLNSTLLSLNYSKKF
jgi:fibronectin-binding autotransporter adhesin